MPSTINEYDLGRVVKADYDYEYKANDGRIIKIIEGDEFILIKKSNIDWWQVIQQAQRKPFYVPAGYVSELKEKKSPDHPCFRKAINALRKSQKEARKQEIVQKPVTKPRTKHPLNDINSSSKSNSLGNERMIVLAGSREDLSVFSGFNDSNKFSELRASTDSLDKFIENENPYDEVPFEPLMSPTDRENRIKQERLLLVPNHSTGKENLGLDEDHDYENINEIIPSPRVQETNFFDHPTSATKPSKQMGNSPTSSFVDSPVPPAKPEKRNMSSLPSFHSPKDSTCLKVMNDGWEKQVDNHTGNKYYYNSRTGEMRVNPPNNAAVNHKESRSMSPKDDGMLKVNATVVHLSDDDMKGPSPLQRRKTSPARFKNSKRIPLRKHKKKSSEESANINNNNNTNFTIDLQKRLSPKQTKSLSPTRNWSSPVIARRQESFTSSEDTNSRSLSPEPMHNGWRRERSVDGDVVFINDTSGERWLELYDHSSGSNYYCNEVTRVTAWELPDLSQMLHDNLPLPPEEILEERLQSDSSSPELAVRKSRLDQFNDVIPEESEPKSKTLDRDFSAAKLFFPTEHRKTSSLPWAAAHAVARFKDPPEIPSTKLKPKLLRERGKDKSVRKMHSQSMILLDDRSSFDNSEFKTQSTVRAKSIFVPPARPMIQKQGRMSWTKLVEAGKKIKKNWIQQWMVLLANNLLFYKDQRQATVTKSSPLGKPESSCDLRGAAVSWAKDKSSKKNVFQIKTVRGLQLLLQHDDQFIVREWFSQIEIAIEQLNQRDPVDQSLMSRKYSHGSSDDEDKDRKKKDKDKKKKSKAPSRHGSDARNSDKVRSKLKKFIGRRPTMEMLQEKGIIKENVFNCPLQKLVDKEGTTIPKFIKMCVEEVETRGLDVDGIYRVSGNLSHVQKLRFIIDQDEPLNLNDAQWEDIHVITGALKMFLRELPEPIIPFNCFDKFINTCVNYQDNPSGKLSATKQLIKSLPKVNRDTLKYLMNHFRRVVEHSTSNRMQVQNIAIVFGPTLLLKPPSDVPNNDPSGSSMAVYMMYQNQIVDYMLTEFDKLFV